MGDSLGVWQYDTSNKKQELLKFMSSFMAAHIQVSSPLNDPKAAFPNIL